MFATSIKDEHCSLINIEFIKLHERVNDFVTKC